MTFSPERVVLKVLRQRLRLRHRSPVSGIGTHAKKAKGCQHPSDLPQAVAALAHGSGAIVRRC